MMLTNIEDESENSESKIDDSPNSNENSGDSTMKSKIVKKTST
jgi:hypothetical protein